MYNSLSTLKTSQLFRSIFTQNYSAAVRKRECYWKLCFMPNSIYLSRVVQIVVIEYGFNDNEMVILTVGNCIMIYRQTGNRYIPSRNTSGAGMFKHRCHCTISVRLITEFEYKGSVWLIQLLKYPPRWKEPISTPPGDRFHHHTLTPSLGASKILLSAMPTNK